MLQKFEEMFSDYGPEFKGNLNREHPCGVPVEELASKYYLSPKTMYKILAAIKYDKSILKRRYVIIDVLGRLFVSVSFSREL